MVTKNRTNGTIDAAMRRGTLRNLLVGAKTLVIGLWTLPEVFGIQGYNLMTVWTRRDQRRRHLADLTDHQLRDVGLTREDLRSEAGKPFWRG